MAKKDQGGNVIKAYSNGTYSLGTLSRDIFTPHFCGDTSPVNITLKDAPSKAVLYTVPISFGFATHPGHKHSAEWERAADFGYEPLIANSTVFLRTGSSNVKAFPASQLVVDGRLSPVYHEEELLLQRWRDVTEKDNAISYVKPEKEGMLIEGPERLAYFDPRDTQLRKFVRDTSYKGPNSMFGKYLSKNANFRQDIRNVMFDKTHRSRYNVDMKDFIEFLTERYGKPRHIESSGVEKMEAIAKLYHDNGTSSIVASTDFHKEAKELAEAYGLSEREAVEFFKKYAIYHEIVHNFQELMPEREAEIDNSDTLYEFFSRKAEGKEGTKEGRLYKALAEEAKKYAQHWKSKSPLNSGLEARIRELEEEARSLGLEGEEAREYVERELENIVEEMAEEGGESTPTNYAQESTDYDADAAPAEASD
jgi:hypothetical protein